MGKRNDVVLKTISGMFVFYDIRINCVCTVFVQARTSRIHKRETLISRKNIEGPIHLFMINHEQGKVFINFGYL